ncbi:MAG: dTDP-4-dehydrorhamnose 3,5-epimerase family protein [Actinomycetota bacterium]|nr:dTDP-4-dehydrorhamnose 3,5-epimerase family protein [Actinomycetota bacterium]
MIDGVMVKPLRVIPDERGRLMEIFRSDDDFFEKFGQVYVTTVYPGVVKAWHMHKKQNDNVCCVHGMVKLALFDNRSGSPTKGEVMEIFMGEHRPLLVHIPREVFHGWKCVGEHEAYVANIPTELYDYDKPDEYRLPWDSDEIPYDWDVKMG